MPWQTYYARMTLQALLAVQLAYANTRPHSQVRSRRFPQAPKNYVLDHNLSTKRGKRLEDDVDLGIDVKGSTPPHTPEHLPALLAAVGVELCHQSCRAREEIREIQGGLSNLDSSLTS